VSASVPSAEGGVTPNGGFVPPSLSRSPSAELSQVIGSIDLLEISNILDFIKKQGFILLHKVS